MLKSLYSGISGMKANQNKLDVLSNNIANIGTTSFKSSTVRFSDMLSQTVSNAMSSSDNAGGVNAQEIGLGVQISSISKIMTQGTLQSTSRNLDIAVDGEGYLIVSKGGQIFNGSLQVNTSTGSHTITDQSLENSTNQIVYTRDGSLTLDEEGNLLTSTGYRVMGYSLTNDDNTREATGVSPDTVSLGGLNFVFGPGSQLNGYKIVLGDIGPNTTTSSKVDNEGKTITLNGDFSAVGALTSTQVETAVNKALSTAGISQSVTVTGNTTMISDLSSVAVVGGTDASAPSTISLGGFSIGFKGGTTYNDYTIKIASGSAINVDQNPDNKTLTITAPSGTSSDDINNALKAKGIDITLTGTLSSSVDVGGVSATVSGGIDDSSPTNSISVYGMNLTLSASSELNGYKFVVGTVTPGTGTSATVNASNKTITINGDFVSGALTKKEVESSINAALASNGIKQKVTIADTAALVQTIPEENIVSGETSGGTPIESLNEDGSLNFIDSTKKLYSYDGELKTLKIPQTVTIAGTNTELRVTSYTIDATGVINGVLENGRVTALGQIAMASFSNSAGLTGLGDNIYSTSVNSGDAIIKTGVGTTGNDNSSGYGDTLQGVLEMSNVDLSEQFTEMIVASRAFQASSKMITTGDEILQGIINLVR